MPPRKQTTAQVYTFRVRILDGYFAPRDSKNIWRDIEILGHLRLSDLGEAIPLAFDFDDPHLWSFFLSGKAWDQSSEYSIQPDSDLGDDRPVRQAVAVRIRDVPYPGASGKKEFLFLFDYGDEWHFGVKLRGVREATVREADFPRVVAALGDSPPQYPNADDLDDEEEYDDDEDEKDKG